MPVGRARLSAAFKWTARYPRSQTNHRVRTAAFAFCFAVVGGVLLAARRRRPVAWTLLLLQFLVYPHLVYWRARLSPQPDARRARQSVP